MISRTSMIPDGEILVLLSELFCVNFGDKKDPIEERPDCRNYGFLLIGLAAGRKFKIVTPATEIEFYLVRGKKKKGKIRSENSVEATKLQTFAEVLKICKLNIGIYTQPNNKPH